MKLCKIGKLNLARALAFITALSVVLLWGIDSYAVSGTGSNVSTNLNEYYDCDLNLLSLAKTTVLQHASNNGFNTSNVTGNWSGPNMSQSIYNNYFNGLTNYSFSIIENVITTDNQVLDFSDTPYHVFTVPSSAYTESHSYAINGSGNICLLITSNQSKYVVSDSQFDVGLCTRYGSDAFSYNFYHSVEQNGFYVCPWQLGSSAELCFTDLPIYLTSSDGSTGFTNFDNNTTDFSFSNNNYNFNYYMTEDLFVNPNAPTPSNPYENDKYYLNFDDTTYYSGGALTSFFHANNFSFNQYVLNNPVNYRLKFEYVATVKRNNTTYTFTYTPDPIQLAYFLGQSSRFGTGSRLYVPLSTDWFVDGYGHTMSAFLKGCVTDVYGTTSNYANPNDVLESDSEIVLDPYYIIRTDEYIQKSLPKVNSAFAFQDFTIDGYVNLYTNDDSNYESYSYHDTYNWATGKSDIISTQNNTPPYEQEGVNNNTTIVPNTNGGATNYNSGSVNPTVNVTVNSGSNLPWTPYTLDQISYGNVKDMFNDIKDFVDTTSDNSFWQVLTRVLKPTSNGGYIPDKIWEYITITIAVICGFAVVRYVLRR